MSGRPDVATLLAGPRGRRLCWELRRASWSSDAAAQVFAALTQVMGVAMYWQPPDPDDEVLSTPTAVAELVPVAEAVLADPATSWWSTPLALDDQRLVRFLDDPAAPQTPGRSDPGERLRPWREEQQRSNERFRAVREGRDQLVSRRPGPAAYRAPGDGPDEMYARMSGTWWSTPTRWEIPLTARALPGVGPVSLWLTEDDLGWRYAHCWPVAPGRPGRVYEITGPQLWVDLVAAHPLDVTDSRRPDWKRATGCDGPWLIPDWSAVAAEFDAVHLSVFGYLTTAGRALSVDGQHRSVLAGWDPDATFWLTDALAPSGPVTRWQRDGEGEWNRES